LADYVVVPLLQGFSGASLTRLQQLQESMIVLCRLCSLLKKGEGRPTKKRGGGTVQPPGHL